MPGQPSSAFSILLVCTGNICRSALAERLGRAYLDATMGSDAAAIELSSAGTRAVVGSAMHPDSALVLRGLGGDPDGHVARQLDERTARTADLTLTMTRRHRRDVLALAPRALARTFTLREAAGLLPTLEDADLPGDCLAERARALVAGLAAARTRRGDERFDDVPDPIGRPLEVHQEVGETIAAALLPLLARIAEIAGT
jgi:protein-tyrosine phosphatase